MITEILLTIFIILTLTSVYFLYIKPWRVLKFYQKQFKNIKYRGKAFPFKPWYNKYFDPIVAGKAVGDPYIDYKTNHQDYDIIVSNMYHMPFLELLHPDFIKEFYAVDKHYDYPKPAQFTKPFVRLTGPILAFTEGNVWKHKKLILNTIFNFQFLKSQAGKIVEVCDRQFAKMEKICPEKGQDELGKFVSIHMFNELFIKIASQVVLTSILGVGQRHQIEGKEVAEYLSSITDDLMNHQLDSFTVALGDWFYNAGIRKIDRSLNHRQDMMRAWGKDLVRQRVKQFEKQIQEKGIKNVVVDDAIKSIVKYKKQNNLSDDDPLVSEDSIFGQFLGFFIGGTDTTSNYLNMIVSYIGKHAEVEQKLREEIDLYMKEDDYSFENLKNFKYVQAIQKQATRIYGPANVIFFREALKDNYLNGVAVKKGTLVSVNTLVNCYSEKYFKEPLVFRPERWLNGECDDLPQFVVTGFSAGARSCIGKQLALLESKIALIKFMKRYKIIRIPNKDFKINHKYLLCPEDFKTKLYYEVK